VPLVAAGPGVLITQGSVYVTPKGKIETRPEVAIAKNAGEQMNTFATEFGLTPYEPSSYEVSATE